MSPVSGASAADFARSLDALSTLLKSTNEQALALAGKMLRVDVQQAVSDAALGTLIDVTA